MKLTLWQHAFSIPGNRPDGVAFATREEAEADARETAREALVEEYDGEPDRLAEDLRDYYGADHEGSTLDSIPSETLVEFAQDYVSGFASDVYETSVDIPESILRAAVAKLDAR